MSGKDDTTELPVEIGDPLAAKIRDSILGVETLRGENRRLADEIKDLEVTNLQLESEIQSLKLTLEQERAERRHYHSLANEIITRLDMVTRTVDDVVKRAQQEVYRQRRETPGAKLPDGEAPSFAKMVEALANGHKKAETVVNSVDGNAAQAVA
jgi:predicted RNase H-like nuclease (RuvC/YqgF family)